MSDFIRRILDLLVFIRGFKNLIQRHVQLFLAFIAVFWVFHRWFGSGIISWGDWWPENVDVYLGWLEPNFWSNTKELGMNMLKEFSASVWMPSFTVAGAMVKYLGFNYELIEKLLWFWPYVFTAPISFYFFWRTFFPEGKHGTLGGILFFVVNTYSMILTMGGHINLAVVYALMPAILALVKIYSETRNVRSGILLGLLATLSLSYEVRGTMLVSALVVLYLVFFCRKIGLGQVMRTLFWFFIVPLLLNMWWIIAFFLQGKREILPQGYDQISQVIDSSYADLAHALTLFHQQWYDNVLGKINPVPVVFFLIPLILVPSLFWAKNDARLRFFLMLALVSIFLVKGSNQPAGRVYLWLFQYLPGFNTFSDPSKFNIYLAFSYSVLFAYLIVWLCSLIRPILACLIIGCLLSVMPVVWLWPAYSQKIGGTFHLLTDVPAAYQQFNSLLEEDQEFYRTLWLPKKQRFMYFSETHPRISLDPEIHDSLKFLKGEFGEPQEAILHPLSEYLLQDAGVKYLVIPDDATNDIYKDYHPKEFYISLANQQSWLKKREDLLLSVYEIKDPEPMIYVRNNWLYTNDFNSSLLSSYLDQQKAKLALILTEAKKAPYISDPISRKSKYLFSVKVLTSAEYLSRGVTNLASDREVFSLDIVRSEKAYLYIPNDMVAQIKSIIIDDKYFLSDFSRSSEIDTNHQQIELPRLEVGSHKMAIEKAARNNLFASGEIEAGFDPQSELCTNVAIDNVLNDAQLRPGGVDGGLFLKLRSYGQTSCFARQIDLPEGQRSFRLSFDYQRKYGRAGIVQITESTGISRIIDLDQIFPQKDLRSDRWYRFSERVFLSSEADSVTVAIKTIPYEDFNQKGASESWYDNVVFEPEGSSLIGEIMYGNLEGNDKNKDWVDPTVVIRKVNNGYYQARISNAASPQMIVLNTRFHPDWVGYSDAKTGLLEHLEVNGFANGFIVDGSGDFTFCTYFSLNRYLVWGFYISATSLFILLLLYFRSLILSVRKRR